MSYDMIDRFLRNNLGDDDYAEYSAALDSLCAAQRTWVGLTDEDKKTPDMGKYVFLNDDWIDGYKTGLEKSEAKLKEKNT